MQTKLWKVIEQQGIQEAAALLKNGEAVAFPTETVYGLGADATSETAVAKIFQAKGRPADNPLIAHVATKEQLEKLVSAIPPFVDKLINAFSPGPLTYVLPSNGRCAENVTAGLSTIGVRMPSHPVSQMLLRECDIPIAAPSANISGKPSPTTAEHVWQDLNGKIAGVLDGGPTGVGLESTVIDCTGEIPIVLRPGGITSEQLEQVIGRIMVDPALANTDRRPKAPGMKYRHYAPEVPMWLVEGSAKELQTVITREQKNYDRIGVMASNETASLVTADQMIALGAKESLAEIAANLYDALRTFKEGDIDLILCETFPEAGIGRAIMNRLKKAASVYVQE
ncbi:threonylcarbamoyl-AMP synthase [Virgibacillus dakarensis]|uniref:Threonylcarbamoyl-AMP synthase n=1 Tax=Lentibacillus populi TaxID=1827502 RepID=A0A9W5U0N4_9BACI|nr:MULTISPECIES: L-threonylcarbamoyladenylate synthase [Bacillaceae]MTW87290.1 threonylcarbamoyl-AMP synthase [Virgibacillus dakarensis]GGB56225.1 threonylcarbamoyl-AMP synthase [Lentibacillus populi]